MATGRSIGDILSPKQIVEVISRIDEGRITLSKLFGFNIGGSNRVAFGGRNFFYDVFNNTRSVATAREPGAPSARRKPQKVGEVFGRFPRSAETIELLDEDTHNRRRIGGPLNELDTMGISYITRQEIFLGQRFNNLIEFQTAGMIRDSYFYEQSGDDLFHTFTSGSNRQVNFQVPAGNKDQLDMLGDGDIIGASWATASTDIPLHIMSIHEAMMELTGKPLQNLVMGKEVWNYIINNTNVKAQAGTSVAPFSIDIQEDGNFVARLKSIPWVKFHVMLHGLEIASTETYTLLIAADHVMGFPDPTPDWVEYFDGSEIVTEGPNGMRAQRFGFYPYAYPIHDPSGWDLKAVFNGIPSLKSPQNVTYFDVTP